MKKIVLFALVAAGCAASACAQQGAGQPPQAAAKEDGLDPTPVDPATDPNIGMFINDWKNSPPRTLYGKLVIRDMLTRLEGPDPQHPSKKGAVLTSITAISHAALDAGASAAGRSQKGERMIFYTVRGSGEITVNSRTSEVRKGTGFTLTPDFDFRLTAKAGTPLEFYVRTEPLPDNTPPSPDIVVNNRFDNDRRVGAHWAHIGNGGPPGMSLITIAPRTIPQPHSHPAEECWLMVEGESILSLGKQILRMTPGMAYKIPPTGVTAHSNLNMGDEPVQMIFMGPAGNGGGRGAGPGGRGGRGPGGPPARDYSRLDNSPYAQRGEQDVDMFMGNWRNAFPRIMHGNFYFRDMLTALEGSDSLHPARRGAVLTSADAVSYVQLEPGSTAHNIEGELKGIQQTFVVNSGTGVIASGSMKAKLEKDMAFILTPGLEFKLTATGDQYMTFYVISEKIPPGFTPKAALEVIDNRGKAPIMKSWVNKEHALVSKSDGLSQYESLNRVEMDAMTMSRPYSAQPGAEEIWIATDGDVDMLFGKEMRRLPAGTAYRIPSTGITAHANINTSARPASFINLTKR